MAHPDHVSELDGFDRFTVSAYRTGFFLAAAGLLSWALALLGSGSVEGARWATVVGITLSVANIHLYDKRIRWLVPALGWGGLLALSASHLISADWVSSALHLGGGLQLAALSALALKEQFCFRIPGLRAVPLFLALGIFASFFGSLSLAAGLFALASGVIGMLAVAKVRMPLHFDIGDRSHYQI